MLLSLTDILSALKGMGYAKLSNDSWWWPNSGTFDVVVGAILTQNSQWNRVECSLENLRQSNNLFLEKLAFIDLEILENLIKPSGFYRAKAKYIKNLSLAILNDFGDFESFKSNVDREWLLSQKGIGFESADAILNYGCYREVFVVDSYTARLLKAFGYSFEDYMQLQEWIISNLNIEKLFPAISTAQAYALSHGMIVDYCKSHRNKSEIDISEIKKFISSK